MGAGAGSSTLGPSVAAAAALGAGAALAAAFAWGRWGRQLRALDPPTAACRRPFAAYSHGTLVPAGVRTVFASGQLGMDPAGEIPPGIREQAMICFENAKAILAEAGMEMEDVVRVNAFVTNPIYLAAYMEVRDSYLSGGARLPASTLMVVSAFAHPAFKVEIEVVAAKA